MVGLYFDSYGNNSVRSKGNYKVIPFENDLKSLHSVKDGEWYEYHSNGQIEKKETYKDGKLNGIWTTYYKDGKLRGKTTYILGCKSGISEYYDENGLISEKGTYLLKKVGNSCASVAEGKWSYYSNGKLDREKTFKDGKLVSMKETNTR